MRIYAVLLVLAMSLCLELCSGVFLPFIKGGAHRHTCCYGQRTGSYGQRHGQHSGRRTGRTYSDIARVVNPNPYAFVGKSPYPGQPFWPQG